ncbi:MAG: chitobiase/beta-hexosaminidase C-terminal domain-containing protein [Bacillota bacterium]|nr:chitobiase/beta-hexosaminidase C-terminal domain-containing protein [Bacillota bacterium]
MLCRSCQKESDTASRVCPYCGQYMGTESALPEYDNLELADQVDERRFGVGAHTTVAAAQKPRRKRRKRRSRLTKPETYQGKMVNWVKVAVISLVFVFVLLFAGFIWLKVTPEGQLVSARMGRDTSADAYWTLGTELLDQGYISRSIEAYKKAEELEPERPDLDEKLMLLAEAYEAANQPDMAEAVYKRIYEELAPEKPEAYRLAINILLEQNRLFEAVSLMQTAYIKTKDEGFYNQRSQLVPQPPTASLPAGRHVFAKKLELYSAQDYEIRYTTGDGELPETGILYEGPITVDEGTFTFRAVCISNDLVSDEMTVRYTITLPSPLAPKTNMESKTYDRPIRVSLRIVDEEDKDVTLYYTIDGTKPDTNSPRYTGEPILISGGRTFLRAIAVNKYGKRSNEMVVEYKVNQRFKTFFRAEGDQFADFTLNKTTMEQFVSKFGQPDSQETIEDDAVTGTVTKALYPWGEARFYQGEEGNLIYYVDTNSSSMKAPRNSGVGMQMSDVTAKFRDMGQVPNDHGDRGIYYDLVEGSARFTVASDDPNTGTLEYIYAGSPDNSTTILQYRIEGGMVQSVLMRYVNRRLSMVQ